MLARACERFCGRMLREMRDKGTWMVVGGQTGCGKSHVAKAVAHYWDTHKIDAWHRGWLGTSSHLPNAEFVLWTLALNAEEREWKDWLQGIKEARLVVLDDLGAESDRFRSGKNTERLLSVLNSIERKWVLITTNVQGNQWVKVWDQRVADRLKGAVYLDLFKVPSYRGRK